MISIVLSTGSTVIIRQQLNSSYVGPILREKIITHFNFLSFLPFFLVLVLPLRARV